MGPSFSDSLIGNVFRGMSYFPCETELPHDPADPTAYLPTFGYDLFCCVGRLLEAIMKGIAAIFDMIFEFVRVLLTPVPSGILSEKITYLLNPTTGTVELETHLLVHVDTALESIGCMFGSSIRYLYNFTGESDVFECPAREGVGVGAWEKASNLVFALGMYLSLFDS